MKKVISANILGLRLKMLRGSQSQREMAEAVGIAYQAWDRYEKGKVSPGADIIRHICLVHAVSADWLLGLPDRGGGGIATAIGAGSIAAAGSSSVNKPQNAPSPCDKCRFKAAVSSLQKSLSNLLNSHID